MRRNGSDRVGAALARTLFALGLIASIAAGQSAPTTIRVGSKNFSEQQILGEIVAQLLESAGGAGTGEGDASDAPAWRVRRRFGLGGTDICHAALASGQLDIYVEYTGTGLVNVLGLEASGRSDATFRTVASAYRERFDLEWLPPIGFNNTYAIAVRRDDAERHAWRTVSDLAAHAGELRGGFTSEFVERPDGYPGLRERYGLAFGSVVDLDPGLMYEAIRAGQVDVICAFSTDGRIDEYGLVVLEDDRAYFPPYDAAPVVRGELLARHPEVRDVLAAMAGRIDDDQMRRMNYEVDVGKRTPREVAAEWIRAHVGGAGTGVAGVAGSAGGEGGNEATSDHAGGTGARDKSRLGILGLAWDRRAEVWSKTLRHLWLTLIGTGLAIVVGVPLGVLIHRIAPARGPVLAGVEVLQTVPSLAMLAFLFAIYGLLGAAPAITALVLYALLPIVLNTFTGMREVPAGIVAAARGVGLSGGQQLMWVELPLAAPIIIAGVRAAAVLTVGVATLSTYIGAGGLGDYIARGLARNDPRLTLLGAIPAAIMAVTLSLIIRGVERLTRRG